MPESNISIIIPCYNESRYIRRCLSTLLDQSLRAHEIIVIDDGSTDQTVAIVKEFPVVLLQQNHAGPAAARNLGARTASGDIIVLVDADMYFDRDYLLRLTAPILSGSTMGTFTKDEFVGNPENAWAICWNLETVGNRKVRLPADYPDECPAFRAIRRESFIHANGFETTVGYEDDTSMAPKLGFMARAVPGAICYHNNPSSLREAFLSARWMGRGTRFSGRAWIVLKYLPPVSVVNGLLRAFKYRMGKFIIFKPVFDTGISAGILSRLFFRSHAK